VGVVEHDGILDAHADERRDVEEPAEVQLLADDAPVGETVVLL
jgi:hypothetical protein